MSVIDYATSANNTVGGINIATGCPPSNVDNALRKIVDDIGEGLASGYFATALPATKTTNYTVLTTDRGKLFNCTSALILALPVAATAGAGFMFHVKANGAAVVLDPNAAELIDGAATVTVVPGASAFVVCTGTAWVTAGAATGDEVLSGIAPGFQSNGTIPTQVGYFKDDTPTTQIHRFRDRVFFGDAAKYTGNRLGANGYGGDWLSTKGASYFVKNSQVAVYGDESVAKYGFLGAAIGPSAIGIAAVAINESGGGARALYAEVFHKSTATATAGAEIQVGNYTTTNYVPNAYDMSGVRGLFISAEGGTGYTVGDSDTAITQALNPAAAAIDLSGGTTASSDATKRYNVGIVFRNAALYRNIDGLTGTATAIAMATGHAIKWGSSSTLPGAVIRSDVTAVSGQDTGLIFQNTQVVVGGTGERAIALFKDDVAGAGAVNYIQITNSRTGVLSSIRAKGTDAAAGLEFSSLTTGTIRFMSHDGAGEHFRIAPASQAVNYTSVKGGTAGVNPALFATGTDTDISLIVRGKGASGVRLEDGGSAAKVEINTTGIGFFAATPVARGALAAPTGTITRTTFATSTVTLPQLAERVYAMINDLRAYGLFS